MNASEIREAARKRTEARQAEGLKRVPVPEWGEGAALYFHLPPTLGEVQSSASLMRGVGEKPSQAQFDSVVNELVFTMAKDEHGERVWTDREEFERDMTYAILINCVNEAGLLEALTEAIGGKS